MGEDLLNRHLERFKSAAPDRFQVFSGVDWSGWEREDDHFGHRPARPLEAHIRRGARGLKVWKQLGLAVRDHQGTLVPVNHQRLEPLWDKAAELGIPVMIHVADPVAFFNPVDRHNERYEELRRHPEWNLYRRHVPPFLVLIEQFADLVLSNPTITFIGAHMGCYAENLAWVSQLY